jgi:hypothetical protein
MFDVEIEKLRAQIFLHVEKTKTVLGVIEKLQYARAPAAGHSTHFNPQHWLLCHMGLY